MRLTMISIVTGIGMLITAASSTPFPIWSWLDTIPPAVANATSHSTLTSSAYGFDAPKVTPVNSTSWDWWYFDVVSEDAQSSAVVVFYTAPETGFVFAQAPTQNILEVSLALKLPGNSDLIYIANFAEKATVVTVKNGASGEWTGTGFSFEGSPDMTEYTINIDDEKNNVKGRITFHSVAPAHYPCGCAEAGQPLEILPTLGWANAVPDAVGLVDLTVNGTNVRFSGAGYHDKNWGTQPFTSVVGSWYWGHGHLGPYSIVWFDALSIDGTESVSAYVALDGKIIFAACTGITVRPLGNSTYPPKVNDKPPVGFSIEIDVGPEHGGQLVVNTTTEAHLLTSGLYNQFTGKLSGGFYGREQFTGNALYEEFQLVE